MKICIGSISPEQQDKWTPVVRRKRKPRKRRHESSDHSDSDSDESEVDVSCSRLVRYEERDQTPGLTVFRRGPDQPLGYLSKLPK
jgi:hypothetical protein